MLSGCGANHSIVAASLDDGTAAPEFLGRLTAAHRSPLEAARGDMEYRHHALGSSLEATAARYAVEAVERPGRRARWGT